MKTKHIILNIFGLIFLPYLAVIVSNKPLPFACCIVAFLFCAAYLTGLTETKN